MLRQLPRTGIARPTCLRALATAAEASTLPQESGTALLEHTPAHALARRQIPGRVGLLATKVGMVGTWDAKGRKLPCTVLQIDRNQVLDLKTAAVHGYDAVQVGCGARQPRNVSRAMLGHFAQAQAFPKRHVAEFRVRPGAAQSAAATSTPESAAVGESSTGAALQLGDQLSVDHFTPGQYVDIRSDSKGKGFAGVMKRYGFKGLRASHGVSISHRAAGSMGQSQDPGRVLPGKKMAGRMGGKRVTVQNVQVIEVDKEQGLLMVKGPVPGPKGSFVKVQDAIKKPMPATPATA